MVFLSHTSNLFVLIALPTVYYFSSCLKFATAKCFMMCLFSIVTRHLIAGFPIKALTDAEELLAEKSKTRFFRKFPVVSQKLAHTLSDVSLVTDAINSLYEDAAICMFFKICSFFLPVDNLILYKCLIFKFCDITLIPLQYQLGCL